MEAQTVFTGVAQKEAQKLEKLSKQTSNMIYQISAVFPFQLFPDKLIIDQNIVTIVRKKLFWKRVYPMLLSDIRSVQINRSILFAAMQFTLRGYKEMPQAITHLWPDEAAKAKRYIIGLMRATEEKIDFSKLSLGEAKNKLEDIGKTIDDATSLF